MSWTWEISTATMFKPDGGVLAHGYSGHGAGINDPTLIAVREVGPIPCGPNNTDGEYLVGPLEINREGPLAHLGRDVCKLIPTAAQRQFILSLGRDPDSFYLHAPVKGETVDVEPGKPLPTGSRGCICLLWSARMEVASSPDRKLIVRSGAQAVS